MSFFVDQQRWIRGFVTTLVFCAACNPVQPHPIQVSRTGSSNACKATFLNSNGREARTTNGQSIRFWLEFSLPSASCSQSLSFSWYNDVELAAKATIFKESDDIFNSTYFIANITEADYGQISFKASEQTVQTFFIIPADGCSNQVPNATRITSRQIRPSGSKVTIDCVFLGESSILTSLVQWYHNKTFLAGGGKFNTSASPNTIATCTFSQSLIITGTTVAESGNYTCMAVTTYVPLKNGTSQTTILEIVPVPVVSYERQLSDSHFRVSMQWKIEGYSNHTQVSVIVNDENFTEYEHSIFPAFDGSMLYTVNISKSVPVPYGTNDIKVCASLDSAVMQESPHHTSCSDPTTFTVSSSKLMYYLVIGALLVALLLIVFVAVVLIYYLVKKYQKKRGHQKEVMGDVRQPLLPPSSATRRSFYDSIHSWPVASSIVRAARRFTNSVSIRAFGHNEDAGNKMIFILYCKPKGPLGDNHVDDVEVLAECLDLGSHHFRCEFDGWHNDYVAVWSNWTIKMIAKADFVILVCTDQFCSVLAQEMGQTFETCRGTVSSAAVTNLLTTHCHKFIPVFLNTKVKRESIPPALLSTTAYELNLKELDAYIAENGERLGKREAMRRYLAEELTSMQGLICLLKQLRGER